MIADAKSTYEKRKVKEMQSLSNQPNKWWKLVKETLGYARDSSVPSIKYGNQTIENSQGKAEIFNSYFVSHSSIDTTNASLPPFDSAPDNSLSNIDFNEEDTLHILKSLDPNKAIGPDGISPRVLKICAQEIAPSLTRLFKLSLQSGKFPDQWKCANVLPLHKCGDIHEINNYRPISLLSCISKVFEKIVFKYVFNFLRDNLKITIHQSGFMPGDSTVNQLVYLYNHFAKALDEKKEIYIVFCDISKAFDKVWHAGLLYKLKRAGIQGTLLAWFESYLKTNDKGCY